MPRYEVTSEFIDKVTGRRKFPGDVIEADGDRVNQLKRAGVIGAEIVEAKPDAEEPIPAGDPVQQPEEAETQEEVNSQEETAPVKRRKERK